LRKVFEDIHHIVVRVDALQSMKAIPMKTRRMLRSAGQGVSALLFGIIGLRYLFSASY